MKKKRDYKREVALQSKADIRRRALRNKARRETLKKLAKKHGLAKAKDMLNGVDIGHKKALASGGSNLPSNYHMQDIKSNRSDKSMVKNPGRKKVRPRARHKVKHRK